MPGPSCHTVKRESMALWVRTSPQVGSPKLASKVMVPTVILAIDGNVLSTLSLLSQMNGEVWHPRPDYPSLWVWPLEERQFDGRNVAIQETIFVHGLYTLGTLTIGTILEVVCALLTGPDALPSA